MEFSHDIFRSLGITLVHSIWQGALVSVLVLFLLGIIPRSASRSRYLVLFSGLLLLFTGFLVTLTLVYRHQQLILYWKSITSLAISHQGYTADISWPMTFRGFAHWLSGYLEPVYPALAIGWLAGFLFLSVRLAGSLIISGINRSKSLYIPEIQFQNLFNVLHKKLLVPIEVSLRISSRMISPMVTGLLKPMVIIPAAALSGLSTEQVNAILIHELAHIKRLDHILVVIQTIAGQVLFFHPVVWFLMPEINRERENCCDDFVLKTNNNPINYIKALAMIQEMNFNQTIPVNALTGKSNQLLTRIRRLVKPESKHTASFRLTVILLFIATIGVSAMTLVLTGNQPGSDKGKNSLTDITIKQSSQPDTTDRRVRLTTVNTQVIDKKDGNKKKMKVVFENDTIREMTVNGKPVSREDMKKYAHEIDKMKKELEFSQQELQVANEKLKEAQKELEIASGSIGSKEDMNIPEFHEFDRDIQGALSELPERLKENWNSEEFRNQMKIVQEEVWKALHEKGMAEQEYWQSHQQQFQEQMKKAEEALKKAFEYRHMNGGELNIVPPVPPVPPVPDFEIPEFPGEKDLTPEIPEPPQELTPDVNAQPEKPSGESLDSKLRELENPKE